jgi:hypothetical protein
LDKYRALDQARQLRFKNMYILVWISPYAYVLLHIYFRLLIIIYLFH